MKPAPHWQSIAERLAESGWSWRHFTLLDRLPPKLHVVEAQNEDGLKHVSVANSVGTAFTALEDSVQTVGR